MIGALGTITKKIGTGYLEIRGHMETMESIALLRSARIL